MKHEKKSGKKESLRLLIATVLAIVACLAFSCVPAQGQFELRYFSQLGISYPNALAVGDFNGDGKLDLAVAGDNVTILLGNGDGTFRLGEVYAETAPHYIVAADLRHNGRLDLAMAEENSDNIWIMLGNGDGTFQQAVEYPVGGISTEALAVGDFNNDGKLDLISLNGSSECQSCINVILGNGDGTFGAPITTTVPGGINGFGVATGHFRPGDNLDIAIAGSRYETSGADILLGNGDGTFTPSGTYNFGLDAQSVAVADFNRDGVDDVAVGDFIGSGVWVLINNGDGTFEQPVGYGVWFPLWVAAQDLNGEGNVDLVAADLNQNDVVYLAGVSVLNGNGDGTFQPAAEYWTGFEAWFVAVGDFNGDHKPDLAVAGQGGTVFVNAVVTLLNSGVVSFSPTRSLDFKAQAVGTTSAPQTVTLSNTGSTILKIASIKASSGFGVTSTCGDTVAPGANCTISASFSPTKEGFVQGTISISDSASSKPQVIDVLGKGN